MVAQSIENKLGGKCVLREGTAPRTKAGPVVTDNGNFIIDWIFKTATALKWTDVNVTIKMIPGVIETGRSYDYYLKFLIQFYFNYFLFFQVFIDMANAAYFGNPDGSVTIVNKPINK
jgi:ribose 5-phosphate isomerase A